MLCIIALLTLPVVGCRDDLVGSQMKAPTGGGRLSADYICSVDVDARSTTCKRKAGTIREGGPSLEIFSTPALVEADLSNESYTSADSLYRADVKIINRNAFALGTPDGITVSGVKVFYETKPVVTAYRSSGDASAPRPRETTLSIGDTGVVRVRNADGQQNFTGALQPYYLYPQIIDSDWFSDEKEWQWTVPPNVARFDFTVRVFAATPGEARVPALAPDTIPQEIYRSIYHLTNSTWLAGTFLRHIIVVGFHSGATQEERQAALDLVSGQVVGGRDYQVGEGEYFVRIATDGTEAPLRYAVERLEKLPQVEFATVEFVDVFGGTSLFPIDGPHYQRGMWTPNADSASGLNWNLEAIAAPRAWGCETGSRSDRARIAVVDQHLRVVPDLVPNVTRQFGVGTVNGVGHGTAVTSVIGARGNNQLQMTGVLWEADLRLYETGVDAQGRVVADSSGNVRFTMDNILDRISLAAREGATVLNLSMGRTWDHQPGTQPQDSVTVLRSYSRVKRLVQQLDSMRILPVLVVGAGNNSTSPYYSVFPLLRQDFPDRVIVVAAARRTGPNKFGLYPTSNRGALVDLAAPGDFVPGLANDDLIHYLYETSYAAPHVTGVVGLLLSFDPRLRQEPGTLKSLVLGGARNSRRKSDNGVGNDSIPMLNAYEALRAAARRKNAPLCGNRVWYENGALQTLRLVNGVEVAEALAPTPEGVQDVHVLHGGKRIFFRDYSTGDTRYLQWTPSGRWGFVSLPDSASDAWWGEEGPTYRSSMSYSHDRDSVTLSVGAGSVVEIVVQHASGTGRRVLGTLPAGGYTSNVTYACVRRQLYIVSPPNPNQFACTDSIAVGTRSYTGVGVPYYAPSGDRVLVSVGGTNDEAQLAASGSWYNCSPTPPDYRWLVECRNYGGSFGTLPSTLYSFWTRPGGGRSLLATSSADLSDIGIADGADEFAVQEERESGTYTTRWVPSDSVNNTKAWKTSTADHVSRGCTTQFRSLATGAILYSRAGCERNEFTFAPLRAANTGPVRPQR